MMCIGIDLGTSAFKLLLMDGTGTIQNELSREYPISCPRSDRPEQNPEEWWSAVVEGIRALTADCEKSRNADISFGEQEHSLVVLDKNGHDKDKQFGGRSGVHLPDERQRVLQGRRVISKPKSRDQTVELSISGHQVCLSFAREPNPVVAQLIRTSLIDSYIRRRWDDERIRE